MEKSSVVWLNHIPSGSLTFRYLFTLSLSFLLFSFPVSSVAFGYQLAVCFKKAALPLRIFQAFLLCKIRHSPLYSLLVEKGSPFSISILLRTDIPLFLHFFSLIYHGHQCNTLSALFSEYKGFNTTHLDSKMFHPAALCERTRILVASFSPLPKPSCSSPEEIISLPECLFFGFCSFLSDKWNGLCFQPCSPISHERDTRGFWGEAFCHKQAMVMEAIFLFSQHK